MNRERKKKKQRTLLELILTGAEVVVGQLLKRGPVVVDVPARQRGEGNRKTSSLQGCWQRHGMAERTIEQRAAHPQSRQM